MYSFSYLEPACCSMSSSNCCFLTCILISQEADEVVWYSHLLKNFPQFIVIHTVKGFRIVNKAEIDVFLELSCSFYDPAGVGNDFFEPFFLGCGGWGWRPGRLWEGAHGLELHMKRTSFPGSKESSFLGNQLCPVL